MSFAQSTFTTRQQQPQYVPQQGTSLQQQQQQPYTQQQQQYRSLAPQPQFVSIPQDNQLLCSPSDQVMQQRTLTQLAEEQGQGVANVHNYSGATSMGAMRRRNEEEPPAKKKHEVCQGFAPRSNNYHVNTITLLESMTRHPPFVAHGQKKEAWEKVAAYVKTHGGPDLKNANYLLCMKRYEMLRKEFNQQEAASQRSSGGTESAGILTANACNSLSYNNINIFVIVVLSAFIVNFLPGSNINHVIFVYNGSNFSLHLHYHNFL
ncbi:hypothetical protein MVEG_09489 [Podila verticillata NRRL 6337]|nr:hypothetical protein MVEG_09489 [Podila verticillata NRRL 6337]